MSDPIHTYTFSLEKLDKKVLSPLNKSLIFTWETSIPVSGFVDHVEGQNVLDPRLQKSGPNGFIMVRSILASVLKSSPTLKSQAPTMTADVSKVISQTWKQVQGRTKMYFAYLSKNNSPVKCCLAQKTRNIYIESYHNRGKSPSAKVTPKRGTKTRFRLNSMVKSKKTMISNLTLKQYKPKYGVSTEDFILERSSEYELMK